MMVAAARRTALPLALTALVLAPAAASAQLRLPEESWRLGASAGAFSPRDAVIVGAAGPDTRLGAGAAFALDVQYRIADIASLYLGGTAAFSSLSRGTEIRPAAVGPSDQATVLAATAGAVFGYAGLHPNLVPTVRLGGGFKRYSFDLDGAGAQVRPAADVGIGFRGIGAGPLEVGAELRYLPGTFDQSRLPTRGITPQNQRQTDLLFTVGVGVRL